MLDVLRISKASTPTESRGRSIVQANTIGDLALSNDDDVVLVFLSSLSELPSGVKGDD